ncbi:hypothetical protein ABB37_01474 [Leptomonas pyrrhocoris]|uniref:Uncharacterized protein n=1 Tax=Leptomonas pyrrhocoris TaxID=157538 RepID=A0A0M9G924_LEPPY|nr:hypothetical protein ABB37_01474 [Leptomonas pyrrhocoris]KPA85056.1 hypothetical protein ABB37_01474 [Leptomonas pyrrhocoris]|eukprot:XP_015663495.1 hypothetical protein ABB37_01474 [Leptomonas pyrrhocoris]
MPPPTRLDALCEASSNARLAELESFRRLCDRVHSLRESVNDLCNRRIPAIERSIEQFHDSHLYRPLETEKDFVEEAAVHSVGLLLGAIDSLYLHAQTVPHQKHSASKRCASAASQVSESVTFAVGYSPEFTLSDRDTYRYAAKQDDSPNRIAEVAREPRLIKGIPQATLDVPFASGRGHTTESAAFKNSNSTRKDTPPALENTSRFPARGDLADRTTQVPMNRPENATPKTASQVERKTMESKPAGGGFGFAVGKDAPAAAPAAESKPAGGGFGFAVGKDAPAAAPGAVAAPASGFTKAPAQGGFGQSSAFGQASAPGAVAAPASGFTKAPAQGGFGQSSAFGQASAPVSEFGNAGAGGGFGGAAGQPAGVAGQGANADNQLAYGSRSAFTSAFGGPSSGGGFSAVPKSAFSGGGNAGGAFAASSFNSIAGNFQQGNQNGLLFGGQQ